jgi:hypothetical protein
MALLFKAALAGPFGPYPGGPFARVLTLKTLNVSFRVCQARLFRHERERPHRAPGGYFVRGKALGDVAAQPRCNAHVLLALVGVSDRGRIDARSGLELPQRLPGLRVERDELARHCVGVPFPEQGKRGIYQEGKVWVQTDAGAMVEELPAPRTAYEGHERRTPWNNLQYLYFIGYAFWNYFTTPFLLASGGVICEEVEPWEENHQKWRVLRATFDSSIDTHCAVQKFYFDDRGMLQRHDYFTDVAKGDQPEGLRSGSPAGRWTSPHRGRCDLPLPWRPETPVWARSQVRNHGTVSPHGSAELRFIRNTQADRRAFQPEADG